MNACARNKRLRESPCLKPAASASDQQAGRKSSNTAYRHQEYYPGTSIPRSGWFHACRICRSWTAFAAESSNGKTVPLCRRCAVKSAADVFPVEAESDTTCSTAAAEAQPSLAPAPAAAVLSGSSQSPATSFGAGIVTNSSHASKPALATGQLGAAVGANATAYKILQQCSALKTAGGTGGAGCGTHVTAANTANFPCSNPSQSSSIQAINMSAYEALNMHNSISSIGSYHQPLLGAAGSYISSSGFVGNPGSAPNSVPAAYLQQQLMGAPSMNSSGGTLDAIAALFSKWYTPATQQAMQCHQQQQHHQQQLLMQQQQQQGGGPGNEQLKQQVSDLLILQQQLQQMRQQ